MMHKVAVRTASAVALGVILAGGGGVAAWATTSWTHYNLEVPKFMGQNTSQSQTKSKSSTDGDLKSTTVGGNYTLMVALQDASTQTDGKAVRIDDNQTNALKNSIAAGRQARLHFTNDWNTSVDVAVVGDFRAN